MPQPERRSVALGRVLEAHRAFRIPVAVILVVLTLVLPTRLPAALGDELSEARARQEALEAKMASQRQQVARLDVLQGELNSDIGETKAALQAINADLALVRKQVAEIQGAVAVVRREYDNLVAQLASLDSDLAQLREEERRKKAELEDRLARLAARIRDAYETDRTSMLEIVLSSGSFTDVLVEVSYTLDVAEQDKVLAEQIKRDRQTLEALQQSVLRTREHTEGLRSTTAAQKKDLDIRLEDLGAAQGRLRKLEEETERELVKQRAEFSRLAQTEKALGEALAATAEAQAKLARQIEGLVREQQQRGNIPSVYNGTMTWPHAGRITQEFGCTGFSWEPPLGSCSNFHRGIDIASPRWTPIRAAADGVVVFAGPNPYDPVPKAWIVIIAHSASLQTWYAHVDNERPPRVREGQSVKQGDVIAYVGSTGRSTGYHTDWRIEQGGTFVNPRLFL